MLGSRYPAIEKRVAMITQSLNSIFEKEHTLSLDRLKTISKRDARQFLRDLPDIHPFVEAYVMLFAFDGHAIPIDDADARRTCKDEDVVEDGTTPRGRPEVRRAPPQGRGDATTCTPACRAAPRTMGEEEEEEGEGEEDASCQLSVAERRRTQPIRSLLGNSALATQHHSHDRPTPPLHPPPRPAQRQPAERRPSNCSAKAGYRVSIDGPQRLPAVRRRQDLGRPVPRPGNQPLRRRRDHRLRPDRPRLDRRERQREGRRRNLRAEYSPRQPQPGPLGAGACRRKPGPASPRISTARSSRPNW